MFNCPDIYLTKRNSKVRLSTLYCVTLSNCVSYSENKACEAKVVMLIDDAGDVSAGLIK